jgi:asparagine synthase (glutamine-hydrolysing)
MLSLKVQAKFNFEEAKQIPSWLDLDFANRMHLRERLIGMVDEFGFQLPSARDQAIGFLSVRKYIATGWRKEIAGVDVSYPLLHRPLVEFMQAIPAEQNVRLGQTRSLMRRALQNVLPEKIRTRKSKGNPTEIILRAFAREGSKLVHLLEDARVCQAGYSDGPALLAALERARHGCESHYPALLHTICLEFWLGALQLRSSIARKTAVVPGAVMASSMAVPVRAGTGKAA